MTPANASTCLTFRIYGMITHTYSGNIALLTPHHLTVGGITSFSCRELVMNSACLALRSKHTRSTTRCVPIRDDNTNIQRRTKYNNVSKCTAIFTVGSVVVCYPFTPDSA